MALLILVIIKGFIHFLGWLCAIYSLPTLIFYGLAKIFIRMKEDIDDSRMYHVWMWLPRCIFADAVIPVWLGQSAGLGYLLYFVTGSKAVGAVVGVAGFIVSIIGVVYSQKSEILSKVAPKIEVGEYFKTLGEAQLDLFAFICLMFSICGVVRIPALLVTLANVDTVTKDRSLRADFYRQFLMTFLDWFTLPFAIGWIFTFWRWPKSIKHINEETKNTVEFVNSPAVRGIIIWQFLNGLFDIPVFTLGVLSVFIFAPWRLPLLFTKLSKKDTIGKRRRVILKQFGHSLVDFLVLLVGLFVTATVYRFPSMILFMYRGKDAADRRWAVMIQFGCIWLDLFTLFCGTFVLVTIYRIPRLIEKIKRKQATWAFGGKPAYDNEISSPDGQFAIIVQFFKFLRDFPFLFCGAVVTVFLWRAFFLWRDLYKATSRSERRKKALYHFGMLFVDIFDTPFAILAFLITVTLWRAFHMWKLFAAGKTRNERRKLVIFQFLYWLLDIPTAVAAALVFLSCYRTKRLYVNLKDYRSSLSASPTTLPGEDSEENPSPKKRAFSWHIVVAKEFGELMLDIPFPVLLLLTLWRMPWCIKSLVSECEDARARRIQVLSTLYRVVKDIPCIILVLLIVLSVWRIPSFIELIKKYQRGDNEHKLIGLLFLELLKDIPFVIMGMLTFWRMPFLIRGLIKDCNSALERRSLAAQYFGIVFLDLLWVSFGSVIIFTVIRVPTLIAFTKYSYDKEFSEQVRWRHTASVAWAVCGTFLLLLLDIFSIFQFLFIFVSIFHFASLVRRIVNAREVYYRYKHGVITTQQLKAVHGDQAYEDWQEGTDFRDREENEYCPLSLTYYRPIIIHEFIDAMRHAPHLALLPLKLAGLIFVPIHYYIKRRTEKKRTYLSNKKQETDDLSMTFLGFPLIWIHAVSAPRMNFWGLDQFFTLNVVSLLFVLPSELAMIMVVPNLIFLTVITFGSPFWKKQRELLGWSGLGGAPGGIFGGFEIVLLTIQVLVFPLYVAFQLWLLLLPLIIASVFEFPSTPTGNEFFTAFFSEGIYWKDYVGSIPWFVWVIQGYWTFIMLAVWHLTFKLTKKYFDLFDPLVSYLWLFQRVFAGRVWGFYSALLYIPTRWSFHQGMLGQILMLILFPVWAWWTIILPFVTREPFTGIVTGLVSLFLTWRGYHLLQDNWKNIDTEAMKRPVCTIETMHIVLPEEGGMKMHLSGTKPYDLGVNQARLLFEGEAFWRTLNMVIGAKYVSAAKMTLYPLVLIPNFMQEHALVRNSDRFDFAITIPPVLANAKIKKKAIVNTIKKLVDGGDPEFEMVMEHGKKNFGFTVEGVVFKLPNLKLSMFLSGAESGLSIVGDPIARGNGFITKPKQNNNVEIRIDVNEDSPIISPKRLSKVGNSPKNTQSVFENVDKAALKTLVDCGFDPVLAAVALADHNNEVNAAVDYLLSHVQPDNTALRTSAQNLRLSLGAKAQIKQSDSLTSLGQVDFETDFDQASNNNNTDKEKPNAPTDDARFRAQSITVHDLDH